MTHFRTTIAFLAAPLVIPLGLSIAAAVFPGDSPLSLGQYLDFFALISFYALPPAYLVVLILGLPAWLILHRRGIRSWFAFAGGGAALGTAYCVVFYAVKYVATKAIAYDLASSSVGRAFNPLSVWFALPGGLISGILFRAIVYPVQSRERPG